MDTSIFDNEKIISHLRESISYCVIVYVLQVWEWRGYVAVVRLLLCWEDFIVRATAIQIEATICVRQYIQ